MIHSDVKMSGFKFLLNSKMCFSVIVTLQNDVQFDTGGPFSHSSAKETVSFVLTLNQCFVHINKIFDIWKPNRKCYNKPKMEKPKPPVNLH